MAHRKNPRRWLYFANETVPDAQIEQYRWATRPIAYQAFPAFIEGRVPVAGWQDIVRAASSMSGEYSIDHGAVILADDDALIRALLDDEARQWFLRRQGIFLLLSDAAIRAGLTPGRALLVGQCTNVQLLDDRQATLEFEDLLSLCLDKTYPQYTLGQAYPWRFSDIPVVDEDLNEEDPGLQIPDVMRNQVIPIYYGPFVDTAEEPVGIIPVFFMGYTFLTAGTGSVDEPSPDQAAIMESQGLNNGEGWGGWGEYVVGLGELTIPTVYAHNLSATDPKTAIVTEDRFNTEFLAPGHAGWPFDTDYVMRNGYRVTVIYARGPAQYAHLTGGPQIRVDVCGWPDADGVMIDQAGYVYQDFLTQHALAYNGAGYTAGPSLTVLPTFPNGVYTDLSMIWTSKIQDFQDMTKDRLGNAVGYLCSMALTKPTPLREILRTFHVTFDCFSAKNSAGQLYIFGINDIADPETGVPIREGIELTDLPAPRIAWDEIENAIDYTVGWNPAQDAPRTITLTKRDQPAIDALKEVRKANGIRNLMYTADDATATDVIGRRLMRLKHPPRYQPLPMRTEGVDREIGEQIRVTHRDGFGANGIGYQLRPMILMKSTHQGDDVTMEALDLGALLGGSPWGPASLPTSAIDGTPEEQATYWIWTADDGTVTVGKPARWR